MPTILFVEDMIDIMQLLTVYFGHWGQRAATWNAQGLEAPKVLAAYNGCAAVDLLQQFRHIDLVVLDNNLPDGDAFGVLPLIRQFSDAPVIAMLVSSTPQDREQALTFGFVDVIPKPFELEQIEQQIIVALGGTVPPTANH